MISTSAVVDDLPQKTLGENFLPQDSANEMHQDISFQSEVRRCKGMPAERRTTLMSAMKATDEVPEEGKKAAPAISFPAMPSSPTSILDMSLCINVGMLIVGALIIMLVMNNAKADKAPACGYFRGGTLTPEVAKQAAERMLDYN